ncbi:magnesium/cobalt transporter CorA [Priestia endophytica]|jgi:magnesium transporter|uniref:magnesium/cobalt transporter CorA n=1 Tax=Priestia endophytica TaxID=135735 RepID=UPI00124EB47F|nr:magnesium/cobalt transporter CorA [Priestia endophytica]KAB2496215.1 magnesium/cobalt transporter CorA [Priestia endophytica]
MIRVYGITKEGELKENLPLRDTGRASISWYWVDFDQPSDEEIKLLSKKFRFHPLSIEDCVEHVQRPKMDSYDKYTFLTVHYLQQKSLQAEEINFFLGKNYVVTFHKKSVRAINNTWAKLRKNERLQRGATEIVHDIIDQIVDDYFPPLYRIEDRLNEIEGSDDEESRSSILDEVFELRRQLTKIRRTIFPMRELIYKIVSTQHIKDVEEQHLYFQDIADHLLKLTELVEVNRDFTSDIRDNYISMNSDRMNSIMMTLTVITTIFMPLSFLAGLYGMNFAFMPELKGKYNYFILLGVMAVIAIVLTTWFRRKGWFR